MLISQKKIWINLLKLLHFCWRGGIANIPHLIQLISIELFLWALKSIGETHGTRLAFGKFLVCHLANDPSSPWNYCSFNKSFWVGIEIQDGEILFHSTICFSNYLIFCCLVHSLSWWSGTSGIPSYAKAFLLWVWGSMQPYGPRWPQGKAPQNSGVQAAAGALSSLSVDERCQEAVSPVSRRVAVGWSDFLLPQKTQLKNGISKHAQIEP